MTIHAVVAMATAVSINIDLVIADLSAGGLNISPHTQLLIDNLKEESGKMLDGVKQLSDEVGGGTFPNTYQTKTAPFKYKIVNNEDEEAQAVANGLVIATFPETMMLEGSPDLIVHNQDEKEVATRNGYMLPLI